MFSMKIDFQKNVSYDKNTFQKYSLFGVESLSFDLQGKNKRFERKMSKA